MTDHAPAHAPRQLAARTVTAVLATVALAMAATLSALGLPQGLARAAQGQTPVIPTLEVMPVEPDRVVVCMGPAIGFSGQESAPVGYGQATDTIAGSAASSQPVVETDLQDSLSLEGAPHPNPALIVTQPADQGTLAGASHQQVDNLNVRGLAVAECQEPRTETWLVGADTTTGRQAVVSLVNPGDVLATVDIDVWGQDGPISTPLGNGILVAPGAQRVFSLAGFAPNEPRPVVRVRSQGTGVVAALHYSIVRGLEPDGFAVITGQPIPSQTRAITGLYGAPEEVIGPIRGKDGYADVGGLLRVLSPGAATVATVTIVRPGLGDITTQLPLEAGRVGDLSLDEIGSGDYSIIVESDEPIVAGVRNSLGTDTRTDTSWVGSSFALRGESALAIPGVGEVRLSLLNPGSTSVSASIDGRLVPLAARSSVTIPIGAGVSRISADAEVFATVSLRGESVLGHLGVLPAPALQEPVAMRIR